MLLCDAQRCGWQKAAPNRLACVTAAGAGWRRADAGRRSVSGARTAPRTLTQLRAAGQDLGTEGIAPAPSSLLCLLE